MAKQSKVNSHNHILKILRESSIFIIRQEKGITVNEVEEAFPIYPI